MCGRYTIKDPVALAQMIAHLTGEPVAVVARRYNVSPTQINPVVRPDETQQPKGVLMRWGHSVQFNELQPPKLLINGRSEGAADKRTFKKALQERRCLVPADGFFEWKRNLATKSSQPYYFRRKDETPFWIAGLYWPEMDNQPPGYIVMTTAPNELMAPIHDRMPVIMDAEAAHEWIAPGPLLPERMGALCASYPTDQMKADPVSSIVNSAANDVPECVVPVSPVVEEAAPPEEPGLPLLW